MRYRVQPLRRHRQECDAGHTEKFRSGEFEDRKKGWKRWACFIFASGTLAGKFRRKYSGKSDWEAAKGVAASSEDAQSWDSKAEPEPAPEPVINPAPTHVTIADAAKVLLSQREAAKIGAATLRKYRTFATVSPTKRRSPTLSCSGSSTPATA